MYPYSRKTFRIRWGRHRLDLGKRTLIMGILNVTPDSFSDGGLFLDPERAFVRVKEMVAQGADIIDIGGESSRPGAMPVPLEEEISRVIPVIEKLAPLIDIPISIDTYKYEVAKRALDSGAQMVNDISGLRFDPRMADLVAEMAVPVIIMHMKGSPQDMQKNPRYHSVTDDILIFLKERIRFAVKRGIRFDRIIIDPGIGFGKTLRHNLLILKYLKRFEALKRPILLGTSRKSFIGKVLDLPVGERLEGTAATVSLGIINGAHIVRVHDVAAMKKVAIMTDAILSADNT